MSIRAKESIRSKEVSMPADIRPMLCTLLKQPFNDPDFIFEIKWDGYRILACKDADTIRLASRGGHDYSKKYPSILRALEKLPHRAVIDGEAVVLNREGKPDFDALQNFNGQQSGVFYYVFDILWLDGKDLMDLPLTERKRILKELTGKNDIIRYSDDFQDGIELFRQVESMKLEGIIAKRKVSRYIPGHRGREWFKIPTELKDEFVVGGWVESQARLFRTLLFGAYRDNELYWIGHAGGGFKDREMKSILSRLKGLEIDSSPFVNEVDYDGVVHWVRPELVANIKYATFTKAGKIRKPAIFSGFRDDKQPEEVVAPTGVLPEQPGISRPRPENDTSNWEQVDEEQLRNEDELDVEGCKVRVYNVDRPLWKGINKADLIRYYHAVAPYLLPHIQDRPLSLHLKLKGPRAPGAYIKDMEGRQPDCASVFTTQRKHYKPGRRDIIDYLICNNTATLLYTINLGCIDVNPWTSTIHSPLKPDYIIIDIDPSDKDFSKVVDTALAAKEVFGKFRLKAFPKTSGKTGIHLYIPCGAFTFPQARVIAGNICKEIHQMVPDITTTEVSVSERGSKVYLDPNQNDYADTVAAPYSVRPSGKPTVSTPVTWREVNRNLDPADFNIHTIGDRLKKKGELFSGVLDREIAKVNDSRLLVLANK